MTALIATHLQYEIGRLHKSFTTLHDMLERKLNFCTINIFFFCFWIYNGIFENVFIYLLTPVYNLLEFISLLITFFICVFNNII